jgi:hypothetical protein
VLAEALEPDHGVEALGVCVVGGPAGRLKSCMTRLAQAQRSSSFDVNWLPWSTRIAFGRPRRAQASSKASMTTIAVADRQTRITGQTRLQVSRLNALEYGEGGGLVAGAHESPSLSV